MWAEYMRVPNLMTAQMWKDLLDGEGLPSRIVPEGTLLDWSETAPFKLMVPEGRQHVADEIIRKL